jgi:subtilisin family serine protease
MRGRLAVSRVRPLIAALTAAVSLVAPVSGASAATGIAAPDGLKPLRPHTTARATPRASAAQAAAGDPRSGDQWALQGDQPMGAASAWRQTTGGDVTVAVIDSGVDLSHPDLAANLWTNPGEIPGNGIDDDGNGYVDDVHGYDFVDGAGNPQDQNGHGTHVAGIIAARGGNGIGGSGVAWRARLMVVRVLDAQARGTTSTVAQGVRYAVANGARIINLSLAGPASTKDLEDAVAYAQQRGVLVVAAAGNDGRDLAAGPTYPAGYSFDNVLGVAATDESGGLSAISDYGPGVDLSAPGVDILSTALGGGYEWRTGTSMAAPHVAGALALLAAARPDLDWRGLRDALLAGVRHIGLPVETGALDAGAALRTVIAPAAWREDGVPADGGDLPTVRAFAAKPAPKRTATATATATTGSTKTARSKGRSTTPKRKVKGARKPAKKRTVRPQNTARNRR